MKGIDLGLRNYYRVQPITITGSCNNTLYPKNHYNRTSQIRNDKETETFKSVLNRYMNEKK